MPVLSEHSTSTAASSSIAASRVTSTSFAASCRDPAASTAVDTTSIATGIDATISTRHSSSVSRMGRRV